MRSSALRVRNSVLVGAWAVILAVIALVVGGSAEREPQPSASVEAVAQSDELAGPATQRRVDSRGVPGDH